jgi:hypothetical protein
MSFMFSESSYVPNFAMSQYGLFLIYNLFSYKIWKFIVRHLILAYKFINLLMWELQKFGVS